MKPKDLLAYLEKGDHTLEDLKKIEASKGVVWTIQPMQANPWANPLGQQMAQNIHHNFVKVTQNSALGLLGHSWSI